MFFFFLKNSPYFTEKQEIWIDILLREDEEEE